MNGTNCSGSLLIDPLDFNVDAKMDGSVTVYGKDKGKGVLLYNSVKDYLKHKDVWNFKDLARIHDSIMP